MGFLLIVVLKNFKTIVIDYDFIVIMIIFFFYDYYNKEYFKNNIKITILLKRTCIKNNFEIIITNLKKNYKTTISYYGFKDIF